MPMAMMGCASASNATDSTFSYLHGDQRATLGATPPEITAAAVAAGGELQLPVDSHASDGLVGRVVMHTVDGTKVEVNVKAVEGNQSEVAVRVGTFGDKVLQQRIMDRIKAHVMPGISEPRVAEPTTVVPRPAAPPPPPAAPEPAPAPVAAPAPAPAPVAPTPVNPLSPTPAPANPLSPATGP
jgi:2-oxoglutarate dehydrogenase E2 component (dihydrolipoamide succinyltransferase)